MNRILKMLQGVNSSLQVNPKPITLCAGIVEGPVWRELPVEEFMFYVRREIDRKLKSKRARWEHTKVWTPLAVGTRVTVVAKASMTLKGFG